MTKTEDNSTLVSIVGVKANKHQSKQAVSELYYTDEAKANTVLKSDGEKKANVHLPFEYDHLQLSNKIGIL